MAPFLTIKELFWRARTKLETAALLSHLIRTVLITTCLFSSFSPNLNIKCSRKSFFDFDENKTENICKLNQNIPDLNFINPHAMKTFQRHFSWLKWMCMVIQHAHKSFTLRLSQKKKRVGSIICFLSLATCITLASTGGYHAVSSPTLNPFNKFSAYLDSSSSFDLANSRLFLSTCSWGVWARSSCSVMIYLGI